MRSYEVLRQAADEIGVTRSIEDDGEIEPSEADRIRNAWEPLKQTMEGFTIACERGLFRSEGSA